MRMGGSGGHRLSPRPEPMLQLAPGACPTHGPIMFVQCVGGSIDDVADAVDTAEAADGALCWVP